MDVHEQSAMGLDSRAVSDRVTKQIVTIFSKTCNKVHITDVTHFSIGQKNIACTSLFFLHTRQGFTRFSQVLTGFHI